MLVDLSCPVDLLHVEVLRDSGGRAQAYLDCKNLSGYTVIGLRGELFHPKEAQAWPFSVQGFAAGPGEAFAPCAWVDDVPPLTGPVSVQIHAVSFVEAEDWEENPEELILCPEENLPPGPDRVALVAIEGKDAVCWPHRFQHAWRCVCGRYNLPIDAACVRCGRDREEVFAYCVPEVVHQAYHWQKEQDGHRQAARQQQAKKERQTLASKRRQDFEKKKQRFLAHRLHRKLLVAALILAAAGLAAVILL